jgi:hypothetical protein
VQNSSVALCILFQITVFFIFPGFDSVPKFPVALCMLFQATVFDFSRNLYCAKPLRSFLFVISSNCFLFFQDFILCKIAP